jgi:hypothetical protein
MVKSLERMLFNQLVSNTTPVMFEVYKFYLKALVILIFPWQLFRMSKIACRFKISILKVMPGMSTTGFRPSQSRDTVSSRLHIERNNSVGTVT